MRLPARLLLGAALTAALAACGRQDADPAAVSVDTATGSAACLPHAARAAARAAPSNRRAGRRMGGFP